MHLEREGNDGGFSREVGEVLAWISAFFFFFFFLLLLLLLLLPLDQAWPYPRSPPPLSLSKSGSNVCGDGYGSGEPLGVISRHCSKYSF